MDICTSPNDHTNGDICWPRESESWKLRVNQDNPTELLNYPNFSIYGKNGPADLGRPKLDILLIFPGFSTEHSLLTRPAELVHY